MMMTTTTTTTTNNDDDDDDDDDDVDDDDLNMYTYTAYDCNNFIKNIIPVITHSTGN